MDVRVELKKAEHQRIDAFELWCWRRLLGVCWIARRSNQSILKEISPEYSLEELMLKLKLQYFGHLMQRTDSFEKTRMLGKIEVRRSKLWAQDWWWWWWFSCLRTIACQAPLSTGFPRQEYWSGLPFPSPGDLPDPGIQPTFPAW